MSEHPLKVYERLDPALLKLVKENGDFAFSGNALPKKFKYLMVMAIDAVHGAPQGVKANAVAAMQAGATKEEIMETLRILQYVCGAGSVYVTAHALENVF